MTSSPRILVVDDHRDTADMLIDIFNAKGCIARSAYDGPEAIAAAAILHPQIAFLDLGMPDMDGFIVAGALREQFGPGICIVALTARTDAGTMSRVAGAGFNLHVAKPASADALMAIVAECVPDWPPATIDPP